MCACDSDVDCRFLEASHREVGVNGLQPTFRHIFEEMEGFVHKSAMELYEDMKDSEILKDPRHGPAEESNAMFRSFLYANPSLYQNRRAHCTACNKSCPVFDTRMSLPEESSVPPQPSVRPIQEDEVIDVQESQDNPMPDDASDDSSLTQEENSLDEDLEAAKNLFSETDAVEEEADEPLLNSLDEWTWVDASTPCVDHSAMGKKSRLQGDSAVPFYIFTGSLRAKRPKVWTHEITSMKTAHLMKNEVGDIYDVSAVEVCSSMTGERLSYFVEIGTFE